MFKKLKFWYYHFIFLLDQICLYYATVFKYAIDNIDNMDDSFLKWILSLDFIQKMINKLYLKLVKKTIKNKVEKPIEKTTKKQLKKQLKEKLEEQLKKQLEEQLEKQLKTIK